jgi:predicted aconitase
MHKAENREPKVLVKLETRLRSEIEYGALGIFLGKILEDKIPIIQGLNSASKDNLKQLGAALASTGMVNMFYTENIAEKISKFEKISIESKDIEETLEDLFTASRVKVDLVFIGCPHCSLDEIKHVADLIGDRKVRDGTELWVCTSRCVKGKAAESVERIERSGGHVITDTCAVVTWTDKLGIETIMTNSAKTAHYAPTLNRAETTIASMKECLETALKG